MAAVVAAGALLAGGCGSDVEGTATSEGGVGASTGASGQRQAADLWDPCTQISDDLLIKIGVQPETKRSGVAQVEVEGWKVCEWHNDDFALSVLSTDYTLDDIRNKEGNHEFAEVTVKGRQGLRYRMTSDRRDEVCDIAFSASQGALIVAIMNDSITSKNVVAPCTRAEAAGEVLVPALPD
ncbi:DUF3558 domain-containing protein [Nocardia cyriacigeorgica]|uniref:DUF3558 domain-containing protein n=1 Tax=Nocardia cyriacigeorgica TaxID=135487 RepID=A0A6P1CK90_9NOCA|nr:DUF3558 domain-containing protein [Nocardia cyriacigeorgica]MBF6083816.1 DUF3558 domain-containing protein [Nocardia cyriacigeorgica]NEW33019.1 DUF3558 domain-containing protein [Nocardia cyriacigeorgica]